MEQRGSAAFSPARQPLLLNAVVCSLLFSLACSQPPPEQKPPPPSGSQTVSLPTGAQAAAEQEDGQWVMAAKNYASTRYSGPDQITPGT